MPFVVPKIAWPTDTLANELIFQYPPVEKATQNADADEVEGVRIDTISLSGIRQSAFYRSDEFKHLSLKSVEIASEIANWRSFFDYAHEGGSFLYYPDSTGTAYDEWVLEDSGGSNRSSLSSSSSSSTNWQPKLAFRGFDEFELVMRKVPGGLSSP